MKCLRISMGGGGVGARGLTITSLFAFHEIISQSALTAIQNSVLILTIVKTVYNNKLVIKISLAVPCFQLQTL